VGRGGRPGQRSLQRLRTVVGERLRTVVGERLRTVVGEGQVSEVVVTYADRLTRFGQEYLDRSFAAVGGTLRVLDPGQETSPEQEFTAALLSLIASFSGRL
jgi:putative resolvase